MMKLHEAEYEIAKILAKVEKETDSIIDEIRLYDVDTTSVSDDRKKIRRVVRITTHRLPGHDWSVGK